MLRHGSEQVPGCSFSPLSSDYFTVYIYTLPLSPLEPAMPICTDSIMHQLQSSSLATWQVQGPGLGPGSGARSESRGSRASDNAAGLSPLASQSASVKFSTVGTSV
eukprot:229437-Hanusia_phi.AAC.1